MSIKLHSNSPLGLCSLYVESICNICPLCLIKTAGTKLAGIDHSSLILPNAMHTDSMSWGGKKWKNYFPFTGTENVQENILYLLKAKAI